MSTVDTVVTVVHLLVAGLWTGSVGFVALGVLPAAGRDGVGSAALRALLGRLVWITRVSALVSLLTGLHMAATMYTVDSLTATTRGHLVVGMVVLWAALAGLVEVGASRIRASGAAADGRPFLYGAAAVAGLLLVDSGLLLA